MPTLSVIIPTITGRERHLERCVRSYRRNTPKDVTLDLIIIRNEPSCGHAWAKGARKAKGDYLHFTADDLQARPGWFRAARKVADSGALPAACVGDRRDKLMTCDAPLGRLGRQPNVLVPFFTREMWRKGGWVLNCHYGTDDWITYLACTRGIKVVYTPRYVFRHWVAEEGRDYGRRLGDVEILVKAMDKAGYVPPVYQSLVEGLRKEAATPPASRPAIHVIKPALGGAA